MKSHQKKYYRSLLFIIVLILATAMLLTNYGQNDLTGMAVED
ncbi:MAG: hypothetical protein AABX82_01555 [Nanoarchaeota archaeon]